MEDEQFLLNLLTREKQISLNRSLVESEIKKFEPYIKEIFEVVFEDFSLALTKIKTFDEFEQLLFRANNEAISHFIDGYFNDIYSKEEERIKFRFLETLI